MEWYLKYLEDARKFDELASLEQNPEAKQNLKQQADAYRALAKRRAQQLGVPLPSKK